MAIFRNIIVDGELDYRLLSEVNFFYVVKLDTALAENALSPYWSKVWQLAENQFLPVTIIFSRS